MARTIPCRVCGDLMEPGTRGERLTCSDRCRQRRSRARRGSVAVGHRTAIAEALRAVESGAPASDLHALLSGALRRS